MEFYYMGGGVYRLVEIATYLAVVADVTEIEYDRNNHVKTPATLKLNVFAAEKEFYNYNGTVGNANEAAKVTLTDDKKNFTYKTGGYVLVNVHEGYSKKDKYDYTNNELTDVLGLAKSEDAAQTTVARNTTSHTIGGKQYDDAEKYLLDDAHNDATAKYTWFFDQYGNVIGSANIATKYNYGTIVYIERTNTQKAAHQVLADLVLMDGSKIEDQIVYSMTTNNTEIVKGGRSQKNASGVYYIDDDQDGNDDYYAADLYRISRTDDDELILEEGDQYLEGMVGKKLQIVGDEFTDATLEKGNPKVLGTSAGGFGDDGDDDMIKVNSATMFQVLTNAAKLTVDSYTGVNKIPDFVNKSVTLDAVDGNGYAEYVYVSDSSLDAATAYQFVFVTAKANYSTLKTTAKDSVAHYAASGFLGEDGEPVTLYFPGDAKGEDTYFNWMNDILDNEGAIYLIETKDGKIALADSPPKVTVVADDTSIEPNEFIIPNDNTTSASLVSDDITVSKDTTFSISKVEKYEKAKLLSAVIKDTGTTKNKFDVRDTIILTFDKDMVDASVIGRPARA